MQTFLPYPQFELSARVLDRQRLGKQRVEALQILDALTGIKSGWANHPATIMWAGYEQALVLYTQDMCSEWLRRGYDNTKCGQKLQYMRSQHVLGVPYVEPPWLGNPDFHRSHRLKLAWKLPDHYVPLFDDIDVAPDTEPEYIWPGTIRLETQ